MEEKGKLLIVDDDPLFVETLSHILEHKGYRVTTGADGLEAIQKASETAFDCILIDVKLPRMNGIEASHEIKKISPGTRVVMMTGYSVDELVDKGLEEGVDELISKPFTCEHLIHIIERG